MVDWSKVPYHKVLRIPSMPPGPLNWADEISGKLTDAVLAFFKGGPLTPEHFELVRGYCEYYVRAPCWEAKPFMDESDRAALAMLRTSIGEIKTSAALRQWLNDCLVYGLDPL